MSLGGGGNGLGTGYPTSALDSGSPSLTNAPDLVLSTMGMSPVGSSQCSPAVMSPMGHHHGYSSAVTPSPVHSTHAHNGGLTASMNDLKICYGRGVYDNNGTIIFSIFFSFQFQNFDLEADLKEPKC